MTITQRIKFQVSPLKVEHFLLGCQRDKKFNEVWVEGIRLVTFFIKKQNAIM